MQKQRLIPCLFALAFSLAACQPNVPETNVSQTKNGVTLTVNDVSFSEQATAVTFVVHVSPEWDLDINSDPPHGALHNNPILFDETGKQYTFVSGTYGLPQPDEETGGVQFENLVTFPPVEGDSISFQTEITISEIPVSQSIHVSIADRQVADIWSVGKGITFSSFKTVPGTVRLVSQTGSAMELEFRFDRVLSDGLRLGCLSFYPNDQELANTGDTVTHFRECLVDEKQVIAKTGMDIPADKVSPISFRVTGSAEFTEPFRVSWPGTIGK